MPRDGKITNGKALWDWRTMRGGAQLVSGAFKDCVEELEPGQHQFFPLTVGEKKGKPKPGPRFILNVVGYIEAIIKERSNLSPLWRAQGLPGWGYQKSAGPWECALDAAVVGNRACWTDLRYGRLWFVSDWLARVLKEREPGGFELKDYCEEVV